MKKFMALYHAPAKAIVEAQNEEMSAAEQAEAMKPWMDWQQRSGDAIVDMGAPLAGGESINAENQWDQSSKGVCGYSIVQAADKDTAKALFRNHVHLGWVPGASVEVHEVVEMY